MDLGLNGRTALVLGAGGGLGSAICLALAREGTRVAAADLDGDSAATTAKAVSDAGADSLALTWDLADIGSIEAHVGRIEQGLGPIDILVAITGGPAPGPVAGRPAATWQDAFRSMVLPVISIADRVLPGMRSRGWGRIITSTSSGVVAPIPSLGLSNSLRSALVGWSKTLAGEVGADGVTANVVLPGRVATKRITFLDEKKAEREGRSVEEVRRDSVASIPLGRYGDPAEYADVVTFLASERASYVTGSSIRVDGGYIANV